MENMDRRNVRSLTAVILCIAGLVSLAGCSGVSQEEYNKALGDLKTANETLESVTADRDAAEKELDELTAEHETLKSDYDSLLADYDALTEEYDSYQERMSPYEDLEEEEAQVRQMEAEAALAAAEEEAAAQAAAEAAAQEEREKMGYDTGITYDQLARTPDEYLMEKVKFYGEVIQVIEGDEETEIRLAIDGDYDQVILCGYDASIVSSRVLEDDYITVYGISAGLISYQSTLGGTITIPGVLVEKIDQ